MTTVQGLTQERLKRTLLYAPKKGVFYWIRPPKNHSGLLGEEAGSTVLSNCKTYHVIKIDGRAIKRSRLAFLYMNGSWPTELIDHIDGDGLNDKWDNLRPASITQNAWNHKGRKKNSDLPMGVRKTGAGRFNARIGVNKRLISLGSFDSVNDAEAAYLDARRKYYGEYA